MEQHHAPKDFSQHPQHKAHDEHIGDEHNIQEHKNLDEGVKAKIPAESKNPSSQSDAEFKDLAKGCIFGAFIGDALGAFLEFQSEVSQEEVDTGMKMPGGGPFKIGPGQVTDDSELAQSLMKGLIEGQGTLDLNLIARNYAEWYFSGPFDIGITIRNAVKRAAEAVEDGDDNKIAERAREGALKSVQSQSNGSLMRITPLAVWASKLKPSDLATAVWEETRLTHPNRVALNASILYVSVIQHLLNNKGDYKGAYNRCFEVAEKIDDPEINTWLFELEENKLPVANKLIGWLKIAFLHALYYLKENYSYEEALRELLGKAGDTDTNLAIVGGVLGALHGFSTLSRDHIDKVLSMENRVSRPEQWCPALHLEDSINELIRIRPTELKMKASESEKYKNVHSWRGPPEI